MKRITIMFIFYSVSTIKLVDNKNSATAKGKAPVDDDRWTWGFVNGSTHDLPLHSSEAFGTTKSPNSTTRLEKDRLSQSNLCEKKSPPMPDFRAPGKRISEQKCEEYLWSIKKRVEDGIRKEACEGPKVEVVAVGGRDARPGEFPHMGAIGWKAVIGTWIFKCGSSLISAKFILTAAHCTRASDRDTEIADPIPKIIRFGDKNIKDDYIRGPLTSRSIIKIMLHPGYKSPKKYNDIALMELDKDLVFNANVQPACLWHQFDTSPLGKRATVTGWGVLKAASRETSPILQVAQVNIIDSKMCDELLKPNCNRLWCGIQDTQICAGNLTGGVDACQGDSGGPLQIQIPLPTKVEGAMHFVVGVTSFGFGCALENTPGVYTRVQPYLDWIESIVWP